MERQGKYEEAEAMHRRALEAKEKVLRPERPHTLISANNLAFLFHRQQHYPAALELYQRAYSGYVKALGARNPTTIPYFNYYESDFKYIEVLTRRKVS